MKNKTFNFIEKFSLLYSEIYDIFFTWIQQDNQEMLCQNYNQLSTQK